MFIFLKKSSNVKWRQKTPLLRYVKKRDWKRLFVFILKICVKYFSGSAESAADQATLGSEHTVIGGRVLSHHVKTFLGDKLIYCIASAIPSWKHCRGAIFSLHKMGCNLLNPVKGPTFLKVINRIYKLNPFCWWLNTRTLFP